jgi:zinc protease
VIGGVADGGVSDAELTGALRRVRRDQVSQLATVEERADHLAYAATVLGEADALDRVLAAYERVTPADLRRVAAEYLAPERAATVVVVPADGEGLDA